MVEWVWVKRVKAVMHNLLICLGRLRPRFPNKLEKGLMALGDVAPDNESKQEFP